MEIWPTTLPQCFLVDGFNSTYKDSVIRTKMDAGPVKTRPRYTKEQMLISGKLRLDFTQKQELDIFYKYNLSNGSLPFQWKDPISEQDMIFRFTEPPKYSPEGGQSLIAELSLEEIPQ